MRGARTAWVAAAAIAVCDLDLFYFRGGRETTEMRLRLRLHRR